MYKSDMSKRVKRNLPLLKVLCGAKPGLIKAVLKGASPDLISALSECSLNVLKGNVRLTPTQKKRLTKYKTNLRLLAKRGTAQKRRRQILQKGGFLPLLLKPIVGALGGLLGSLSL